MDSKLSQINKYFGYIGDREGRTIEHYIMDEYEEILNKVFEIPKAKTREIYQDAYKEFYRPKTKKEWVIDEIGASILGDDQTDEIYELYYMCMHDYDMGVTDTDDYAWLCTLLGYDIGVENALEIIRWYYEERDTTLQDAISVDQKETLRNICEMELDIHLDFSKWPDEEPGYIGYDWWKGE